MRLREEQSVSVLKEGIIAPRWRLTRSQTVRQQLRNYEIKPLPGGHLGGGHFCLLSLCTELGYAAMGLGGIALVSG